LAASLITPEKIRRLQRKLRESEAGAELLHDIPLPLIRVEILDLEAVQSLFFAVAADFSCGIVKNKNFTGFICCNDAVF